MRVSKEEKARSRARILEEAARLFRENGIEATGVADIMSAAGMTHGGFYRHFKSKDELAAAAIDLAVKDSLERLQKGSKEGNGKQVLERIIDRYLSVQHVAASGQGCPVVALGTEAARGSKAEQAAIDRGIDRIVCRFSELIGGNSREARQKASGLFSMLMGTIVLARAARTKERVKEILAAGRKMARCSLEN